MADAEAPEVRAGGGLVVRAPKKGSREVLLVHRPRYDDWTFPKGKCDSPEESYKQAALREVEEETGFRCTLGTKLRAVDYSDRHGRNKRVQYWEMAVRSGSFAPNDEVDEIKWVAVDEVDAMLSYKRDRRLFKDWRTGTGGAAAA